MSKISYNDSSEINTKKCLEVRYHYGFRRFANGNVEGPYAWTNPARQPIPQNIVNRLLDIYTHCSNQ